MTYLYIISMLIPREVDGNTNKLCQTSNRFVCNFLQFEIKTKIGGSVGFSEKKCGDRCAADEFRARRSYFIFEVVRSKPW